jgi:hypothetical protein
MGNFFESLLVLIQSYSNVAAIAGRHVVELCGSNNKTYSSWCHMVKDACATGYVIDTQAPGHCPSGTAHVQ